jgi:hypothetical protein
MTNGNFMFTFATHLDVEAHGLPLQDAHQLQVFFFRKKSFQQPLTSGNGTISPTPG